MFQAIVTALRLTTAKRLRFLGLSEPSLHPLLPQFLSLSSNSGLSTHVISNGSFVMRSERRRALVRDLPAELEISIDAATGSTYERIRRKPSRYFEELCEKAESFFEEVAGKTIRTVSFVAWKDTEHEIEAFENRWRGKVDRIRIRGAHTFSGQVSTDVEVGLPADCAFLTDRIFVDLDGTISVCNLDQEQRFQLGKVLTPSSVQDSWIHPKRLEIVNSFRSGIRDAQCVSCSRCASAQ